jgi:hypothetical protein
VEAAWERGALAPTDLAAGTPLRQPAVMRRAAFLISIIQFYTIQLDFTVSAIFLSNLSTL